MQQREIGVRQKIKMMLIFVSFPGPSISEDSQGDLDQGNMKDAGHNQRLFDAPAPPEAPLFH